MHILILECSQNKRGSKNKLRIFTL